MSSKDFQFQPHEFWQQVYPAGTFDYAPADGYDGFFPARLPDERQIALPIRPLSGGETALASLIVNQAGFEVVEALAGFLAEAVAPFRPEVVVGLPTLGLTLAAAVARHLGHSRYVPLGTSRKFWYREDLSVPMRSVTSPDQEKRLYVDPRMLPVMEGKRVLLVDDVISSGTSILSGLKVLCTAGIAPVAIGAAMLQTRRWEPVLAEVEPTLPGRVVGVFETPLLHRNASGGWVIADTP